MSVRSSFTVGRLAPGEQDAIIGGQGTWEKWQKKGIIFCHGAGDKFVDPFRDQRKLLDAMGEFATVHVGDLGFNTWANDVGMARVESARQILLNQGVEGPVGLVGMSMGNSVAMAYAKRWPERVAGIAGVIPLINFAGFRAILPGAIDEAYPNPVTTRWTAEIGYSASEMLDSSGAVIRRNRSLTPYAAAGQITRWTSAGRAANRNRVQDSSIDRAYLRATTTVNTASNMSIQSGNGAAVRIPVTPGEQFRASAFGRHACGNALQCNIRVTFFDSSGTTTGARNGPVVTHEPNTWQSFEFTNTAHATATSARVDLLWTSPANPLVGDTYDMTKVMYDSISSPSGYFDGDSPGFNRGYLDDVDGPTRSPIQYAASLLPGKPVGLWSAPDDSYTLHSEAVAFKAARPDTHLVTLPYGFNHTDYAVSYATYEIADFMRRVMAK